MHMVPGTTRWCLAPFFY